VPAREVQRRMLPLILDQPVVDVRDLGRRLRLGVYAQLLVAAGDVRDPGQGERDVDARSEGGVPIRGGRGPAASAPLT